jgi:DNA repair ATPase RecN
MPNEEVIALKFGVLDKNFEHLEENFGKLEAKVDKQNEKLDIIISMQARSEVQDSNIKENTKRIERLESMAREYQVAINLLREETRSLQVKLYVIVGVITALGACYNVIKDIIQ